MKNTFAAPNSISALATRSNTSSPTALNAEIIPTVMPRANITTTQIITFLLSETKDLREDKKDFARK